MGQMEQQQQQQPRQQQQRGANTTDIPTQRTTAFPGSGEADQTPTHEATIEGNIRGGYSKAPGRANEAAGHNK